MTGFGGEPTFYLNDLAGQAGVDVSGVKTVSNMDEKPVTTFAPIGVINTIKAEDAQKWFQFVGGKADTDDTYTNGGFDGDVMFGVKSNTLCAFTDIPSEAETNTTLLFHKYNLQNDYLGTLSKEVFGFAEGVNLFSNVPAIKTNYDLALVTATKNTNKVLNDISSTIVNGVDISKKLANTILTKYPERFELMFGSKIFVDSATKVPNGHLGFDSSKVPGKQTTFNWFARNVTAEAAGRTYVVAKVSVTLLDQNIIDDMVLTQEGNGYKFKDNVILCKSETDVLSNANKFIEFKSILDVQATTFNQSVNLEDILYSTTDPSKNETNAYITRRLFLPGLTSDATLVAKLGHEETGTGASVDVSCNVHAEFQQMDVTERGEGYAALDLMTVSKYNATITHLLTVEDAIKLNLGVLAVEGKVIDSSAVYNDMARGDVTSFLTGSSAIVDVRTNNFGTDISNIIVNTTGSGYQMGERVVIVNMDNNEYQTIDLSLTKLDANLLNGLTVLDLSHGDPLITTRSFYTTDNGVPAVMLGRVTVIGKPDISGSIIEVDSANNGTWVKKLTVRDGLRRPTDPVYEITDTIRITNINDSSQTIDMSLSAVDASFAYALNKGEEYILTDPADEESGFAGSLVDSSNALTNFLTGGIVFMDGLSTNVQSVKDPSGNLYDSEATVGFGAHVYATVTGGKNNPVVKLDVKKPGTGYVIGDTIRITRNYQTIEKVISFEDASLLNGDPKEIRGIDDVRTITSYKVYADGATGYAVSATGSGALIRVDTVNNHRDLAILTILKPGSGFELEDTVTITNPNDATQHISFTLSASAEMLELNGTSNTTLDISFSDIPLLFKGGVTSGVRAVKNGVDNKYSEAVVDITCDGSPNGNPNVGAKIEYITLVSPGKPGTVYSQDELYYTVGDKVTFTVNELGQSINDVSAINQFSTPGSEFVIKYVITIDSLTQEQTDVLNGKVVGTNVPLLPGDILAIKSTIVSPGGVTGQEQFEQTFLTHYSLAA
jgi:hypothetical protein